MRLKSIERAMRRKWNKENNERINERDRGN